jgi:hypothetical protein
MNSATIKQRTISFTAAHVTFWAAALFLALLVVLHLLKPEYDPSWRMISEYAIGRFGWVLPFAFFSLALASLSATAAMYPQVKSIVGYIVLILLPIAATGLTIGAIFPSDPITTAPDALSENGKLHILGATIGIPAIAFAVALISLVLIRNQAWANARRWLWLTAGLVWLSFVALIFIGFVVAKGTLGPDVLIGWPNRLFMIGYSLWLMVLAWPVIQLGRQRA